MLFLVWVGWLYVILMLSLAQNSLLHGSLFFVFLGILPSVLLARRVRKKRSRKALEQ